MNIQLVLYSLLLSMIDITMINQSLNLKRYCYSLLILIIFFIIKSTFVSIFFYLISMLIIILYELYIIKDKTKIIVVYSIIICGDLIIKYLLFVESIIELSLIKYIQYILLFFYNHQTNTIYKLPFFNKTTTIVYAFYSLLFIKISYQSKYLLLVILLVMIIGSLLLILNKLNKDYYQMNMNNQLINEAYSFQKSYHSQMRKEMNQIKQIRHNIKHTLYLLMHLIQRSRNEDAIKTIEKILHFQINHTMIHTGIEEIDGLIEHKKHQLNNLNIEFKEEYIIDRIDHISLIDFIIILGNLLDICLILNQKESICDEVTLQINHQNHLCHIILKQKIISYNHYQKPPYNKSLIENIQNIIKQYQGYLFYNDDKYHHSIIICMFDDK